MYNENITMLSKWSDIINHSLYKDICKEIDDYTNKFLKSKRDIHIVNTTEIKYKRELGIINKYKLKKLIINYLKNHDSWSYKAIAIEKGIVL